MQPPKSCESSFLTKWRLFYVYGRIWFLPAPTIEMEDTIMMAATKNLSKTYSRHKHPEVRIIAQHLSRNFATLGPLTWQPPFVDRNMMAAAAVG
jgi:hypothetical protein